MKRSLVTGGTGFIGGRLTEALLASGREVRCLVRTSSDTRALQALGVECVVGELQDDASLRAACEGVEEVYHLAALLKAPWHREFSAVTAEGCGRIAAAAAAQPAPPVLVLVSSLAAAGPSSDARDEARHPAPVSRYGRAKLAGEEAARAHAERVPLTIVRPPLVLGEGDRSLLPVFKMAQRGLIVAPSRARLSLIHVDDLVACLIAAAERGERVTSSGDAQQGVYFAAADEALPLAELGREIASALGEARPATLRLPIPALWAVACASEAWGRLRDRPSILNLDKVVEARAPGWVCSAEKAKRQLGFAPAPLTKRLLATAEWYRREGWLK